MAVLIAQTAAIAQPVRPIAFAPVRTDREALRAQILNDERQSQRERLVDARMRLAERIQAADLQGIEDSRRAIERIEQALDSLGREIERQPKAATRATGIASVPLMPTLMSTPAPVREARSALAEPPPFAAVWWDVYASPALRPAAPVAPTAGTNTAEPLRPHEGDRR